MNKKIDRRVILEGLLRNVGGDKPSQEFTSTVMEEVRAETSRKSEIALLLRSIALEEPPVDFVPRLITQLNQQPHAPVRPVISRQAWMAIAAFLVITLSLVMGQDSNVLPPTGATPYMVNLGMSMQNFLSRVPMPYLVTVVGLAMLLLVDYLLTRRRLNAPKG